MAIFRCLNLFCITTLCDWLVLLVPLSQPIRTKIKTCKELIVHVSCYCIWPDSALRTSFENRASSSLAVLHISAPVEVYREEESA